MWWALGPAMAAPLRILVVDDNHLIRRLLDLILEGVGFVPLEAESGEAALEVLREWPPDLCIVDEVMPGMHGSELIRLMRRSPDPRVSRIPVVGISGRPGGARELLAAGASVFVSKPVEEQAILAAIARTFAAGARGVAGTPAGQPAA